MKTRKGGVHCQIHIGRQRRGRTVAAAGRKGERKSAATPVAD